MSLSLDDVRKIASLARIELDDAEADRTLRKLNGVFDLIETMQAVDTSGVAPMSHPQDAVSRLRDDVATEPDRRDACLAIAPATERGLYLVPRVIE